MKQCEVQRFQENLKMQIRCPLCSHSGHLCLISLSKSKWAWGQFCRKNSTTANWTVLCPLTTPLVRWSRIGMDGWDHPGKYWLVNRTWGSSSYTHLLGQPASQDSMNACMITDEGTSRLNGKISHFEMYDVTTVAYQDLECIKELIFKFHKKIFSSDVLVYKSYSIQDSIYFNLCPSFQKHIYPLHIKEGHFIQGFISIII